MILVKIIILLFIYINNIKCFNMSEAGNMTLFNNDLNHMFFGDKYFILYLGSEVAYFKIESNLTLENANIILNNEYLGIEFFDYFHTLIKITNNYTILYLGDNKILFYKENERLVALKFIKSINETDPGQETYNINYKDNSNITVYFSNVENLFIKTYFFAFALVFAGCFSVLYGAYHYMYGLVIHLTILTYFFFFELYAISSSETISELSTYLFIFFCFLLSLTMAKFLYTEKKNNKRFGGLRFIYGLSFGFILFKMFCYYYLFLDLIRIKNSQGRVNAVFAIVTIFTLVGGFLNLFNPFKKFIFLPCAAVSGSWYIIKGAQYLIGGFYSDIVAIKENIEFDYVDNRTEYILTYFFIQIFIIIFSIIFQIKHIEYKQTELEGDDLEGETTPPRISNASNTSRPSIQEKNEPQELIEQNPNESINKEEEENDNEINDQED